MNKTKLHTSQINDFIYAGNAKFTIQSCETQTHFTYKVTEPDEQRNPAQPLYFVGLLTGTDNEVGYTYIGILKDKTFIHGAKSKISNDAKGVIAFGWFIRNLYKGQIDGKINFYHEGCCCRCGRTLTTPESVRAGIGPECSKKKQVTKI